MREGRGARPDLPGDDGSVSRARLIPTHVPGSPRAVVLVLHGGASRPDSPDVTTTQLSVVRMAPIARRVARADRRGLAVYRLLNSTRGWDSRPTPVDDVHWAIDQVAGDLPVGLVGHSLGGRAALLSADQPAVRSVVALNPWVYPRESFGDVAGREILFVHGTDDRIASPARSEAVADEMGRQARVGYVSVRGGKHAMLRRHGEFSGLAAHFMRDTLLGRDSTGLLADLRSGDRSTVEV